MNCLFQRLAAISIVVAIVPIVAVGCMSADTTRTETIHSTGTIQMSLTGVGISGTEYRLRYAAFDIFGASALGFSSEDYLDVPTVQMVLQAGDYQIELEGGWTLERRNSDIYEPVNAVLLSDNPVAFTIVDQQTTSVAFRFKTDGEVINLGQGTLDVSIEVDESAAAGVQLEPGSVMNVGQQPTNGLSSITSGDLNGDGWPDIAMVHWQSTGGVVLNQQQKTFAPEVSISESWWNIPNKPAASSVTLADLDVDGNLDYVFGVYGADYVENKIQVYEGDGMGNHTIPAQVPNGVVYELSGTNPMGNRVADFDHNGLPDIVSGSNNGSHTADIILQTSPWVFQPKYAYNHNGSANPQWIDIGDFNNDGWMDLVVPFLYGQVEVYLNTANGTGAMTYAGAYLSAFHERVAIADFNGDGLPDIVARAAKEDHVDVLYNDGTGAFSTGATFTVSGSGGMVQAGDIDGDGTMNLVVCSQSTSTVDVLLNDGLGSFGAAVPISLDEPPSSIVLDDFDQDGDLDVAVYTSTYNVSDHLRVLWNRRNP